MGQHDPSWEQDGMLLDGGDIGAPEEETASRGYRILSWPVLLTLGFVVYELFAEPALGVTVACLKFGLPHLWAGIWLLAKDPKKRRAVASACCYWGYGALRVGAVAFPTAVVIGTLMQQRVDELVVTALLAFGGIACYSALMMLGVLLAWWWGVKVWLSPAVPHDLRLGPWPPRWPGPNRLGVAVKFAMLVCGVVFGLTVILLLLQFLRLVLGRLWRPWLEAAATICAIFLMFAIPLFWYAWGERLEEQVPADDPESCWPDSPADSVGEPLWPSPLDSRDA